MKRIVILGALAVAAAAGPAAATPLGSQSSCVATGGQSCRFVADSNFLGTAGATDTGWTLTHKVRTAGCDAGVTVITTRTVVDDQGGENVFANPAPVDAVFAAVYTLTVRGDGVMTAGGIGQSPTLPTGSEPPDSAVDDTNGAVAGAPC